MKATIQLNSYEACRTNTGRAHTQGKHYDMDMLVKISGANINNCIAELNWCAEHNKDDEALQTITQFANALLSAYEIQRDSYI